MAVAQYRVAVGDTENFLELVADEKDRFPLSLQLGDDRVKLLDFLVGQGGRRLVHNDDLGIDRQRAGDGDEVFARNPEIAKPRVGRDFDLKFLKDRLGACSHRLPVEKTQASTDRVTHEDIFDDGEFIKQDRLLVRRGDPEMKSGFGVRDGNVFTMEHNATCISCVDAGQDLD